MAEKNILQEGISLYERGKFSGALTFFLSLPDNCGADPVELAYYLGLCYSKLKRYDDSLLYLEQVVTAAGDNADSSADEKTVERVMQCRFLLAVIYCLSGRKKLADFGQFMQRCTRKLILIMLKLLKMMIMFRHRHFSVMILMNTKCTSYIHLRLYQSFPFSYKIQNSLANYVGKL